MKREKLIFMLFFLLSFHCLHAREKLSFNLQEAREYALKYNRTMKNSGLSVTQAQEKLWEAVAAGLPQVNASTDYTNAMGAKISIQFQEGQPATEIPIKPTSNFNLQVGQLLFNGSYLVGVQIARLYGELSEKNLVRTERDVLSQVSESYYLVLVSEESLKILKANTANLQNIYTKMEPMIKVGMREKVELDQLAVQVNSLNNAVNMAERQYELAKNMLRLQLGVSADTEIELTERLTEVLKLEQVSSGLAGMFRIDQNIDFQLLNIQEEMTRKQLDLQKAGYLPTLSGYYSFTHKILKPAFDMSPPHVVGFRMDIPLFSSGERRSKVRQAKIDLETVQNNKLLLEDQLSVQYKQLSFNLKSAIESYENQKRNIEVSREVYENLKLKYEQGIISGLELTTADNNYLKAESDFLTAAYQVLKAQNELNTLTGNIQ
ncbi:MAG: TolC family protein [Prolixibacteraceae bacterium]|nr:TolC family protein [Prolixibacteraceae bacterium]